MIKRLLFFLSCFSILFAAPLQERTIDRVALRSLATELGISPERDLLAETQKQWLRKPFQERWELTEISPEKRLLVLAWAEEHGLLSAWKPSVEQYDKALLLGGTTCRMQRRLQYLKKLWDEGVRFNEIVWLTGDRPLDSRIDSFVDCCTNESAAARLIWEEENLPKEMRNLPVLFVAVPMNGSVRPNTKDTVVAWLKKETLSCKALFVSDQPFCGYQFAVIKKTLPDFISFDVVGEEVTSTSHPAAAAIILDSIARWIYAENE